MKKDETMSRRAMYWPDRLWERVQEAAARQSGAEGKHVSAAEWTRTAVVQRLERQART